MEIDTQKLVIRAQKGDKDAFGQIYAIFFRKIFRFVYYSLLDRSLSEDIVQDTFVRAWRSLPTFSLAKGTFQAFLFAIARNLVIDHTRKKKEFPLELADNVVSGEDLEGEIIVSAEKRAVQQALSALSDVEKQLVILHYFEEFSYKEIAKITGKNAGAVRVRVHRALKKLKDYLEKEGK